MAQVNAQTFSIIEENEIARKKIWDLMLQDAFFIGLDDGKSYGILNQPNVNVNTTVKAKKFSAMTDSEFQAFLAQVGNAYGTNNAYTMTFDTMLVPTAEIESFGKSTLFPNAEQPYTRVFVTVISIFDI